jgi:hypothetical protein
VFTLDVEAALQSAKSAIPNISYTVAGRRINVEVDAEWASHLVRSFFSGFHLEPVATCDDFQPDLSLIISQDAPPPTREPALREFEVPGGVCRANDRNYVLDVVGGRVEVAAREESRVSVWLGLAPTTRRSNTLITLMAYAMPAALRRCGLYDLHACGSIEPDSRSTFIFPGGTGSGKTTLAMTLAACGWLYLSDDLLTISEGEQELEARPLRRSFQPDDKTLAACPRLLNGASRYRRIPNDPEKRRLDPDEVFPGQIATVARPDILCFPSIVDGAVASRLESISKVEAMSRLISMCPWSRYDLSAAHEHLRLLERLVRQCRTYALEAGRDILDDHARAGQLLSSVA